MCYDIKASKTAQLKRALHRGDAEAAAEIRESLLPQTDLPLFHASGFSHPRMLIYTDQQPDFPCVATWGLVPHWVRDHAQQQKLWNQTLNARGETVFEKPSFRTAARNHRCLLYVDGFYEHHHHGGKAYPYFIYPADGEPMALACLYSDWANPETGEILTTFSIVTTEGNPMMARIHNNPKLAGPRMPLILPENRVDQWLEPIREPADQQAIEGLIRSFPEEGLKAHTVGRLRGKAYTGNVPEVSDKVVYPELEG
ncbi:SOS response-associated peptidase [Robiginitalea sp. M366]|uniref:SOS response-associated peptidase n=1 Tax=Robiginitalea aestuariiviva TaxID=3036903 RepID=UPI00240DF2EA|nr:SOS response-associated peptidase [Robiginitalea aestuariiviva]MDG1570905.1 SOS response-associated peptidase [Robiginitalea aestuariiviva]